MSYRDGRNRAFPSPDGRYALIFSPGCELTMMRYLFGLALIDARGRVTRAFHDLQSPRQDGCWSPDSQVVAFMLDYPEDLVVLCRPDKKSFAVVATNVYQFDMQLDDDALILTINKQQFEACFGKQFSRPRPSRFKFTDLKWRKLPTSVLTLTKAAVRGMPAPKWDPPPSKDLLAYAKKNGITINWK